MNKSRIIAITGGIGSGKSVVSKLLRVMDYPVYDCDEGARRVMTQDPLLREQLVKLFGNETYIENRGEWGLNKPYLANRIFSNSEALAQMNACVHPAVARDLLKHRDLLSHKEDALFFFESAILYESSFDKLVPPNEVWTVSAPLELRIERAMQRDGATREKVLNRIEAQMSQEEKEARADHIIFNDLQHSLIAQVNHLLIC